MNLNPPDWEESPFDRSQVPDGRYAIETRAESTRVLTGGDAARRGESDRLKAGAVESFVDVVGGEENTRVNGPLREQVGHGSRLSANRLETTVHGRMSISAVGKLGEDGIVMGGALTDTWTGGLLIAAAMSDDLVVGAGARLTAPVDVWLNRLQGMEERPGTAAADGVMLDICGTLFEREYGPGVHAAGIAVLSGTVYQTHRVGFRSLLMASIGVRNLLPGGGAAGGAAPPPAPPPVPVGAAQGTVMAAAVVGSAARTPASIDNFQDVGRVIRAADEFENAGTLRRAGDTAAVLEEVSTGARNLQIPMENPGRLDLAEPDDLRAVELPPQNLPSGFDQRDALRRLDDLIEARMDRMDALELQGNPVRVEPINGMIAQRLEELEDLRRAAGASGALDTASDPSVLDPLRGLFELDDALPTKGPFEGVRAPPREIAWPGKIADDMSARLLQLEGEIDAFVAIKAALDANEDPIEFLTQLGRQADELHGAADPRTTAFADVTTYYKRLVSEFDGLQDDIDIYMLARAEIARGLDPRVRLRNDLSALEPDSHWGRSTYEALTYLNSNFQWAPDAAGNPNLAAVAQSPPVQSLPVGVGDNGPTIVGDSGSFQADELVNTNVVRSGLDPLDTVSNPGLFEEIRQILDLDNFGNPATGGLRLDTIDGVGSSAVLDPVQPQLDDVGAGWTGAGSSGIPSESRSA